MSQFRAFAAEERILIRGQQKHYSELSSLEHWVPVVMSKEPEGIWWRYMLEQRFIDPFFSNTIHHLKPHQRFSCFTPIEVIEKLPNNLAPTAFIFHISRCGSTLLTQLLASVQQCIVMSEPSILDSFFRQSNLDNVESVKILQGLIYALGQKRFHFEEKFFIKLDSWHLPYLPLLRKAFPQTPCLFLYRNPEEVLNSHRRQRGPQMIPGWMDAEWLQLNTNGLEPSDFDGYCATVLESFFKSALDATLSNDLILLNYQQLPSIVFSHLLELFSIGCTQEELDAMKERSQFHA